MALIYPAGDQQETTNLGLATWGMDEELANNMIILDNAIGNPTANVMSTLVNLPNVKLVPSYMESVGAPSSSYVPIYTVPAGRRAIIGGFQINNNGSSTSNFTLAVNVSGSQYNLSSALSVSNGSAGGIFLSSSYIAEAGETISILQATSTNFFCVGTIVEFSNTSALRSAKNVSLVSGDNVIYTPSTTKNGLLVGETFWPMVISATGFLVSSYVSSGSISTIASYLPKGTTVSSLATQLTHSPVSVSSNVPTSILTNSTVPLLTVANGDSISINLASTPTVSGMAWANVIEF